MRIQRSVKYKEIEENCPVRSFMTYTAYLILMGVIKIRRWRLVEYMACMGEKRNVNRG